MTEAVDIKPPVREKISSGDFYLYDKRVISELQAKVGERPVVVLNGMNTIYAPAEGDPDGERIPYDNVQETIRAIREEVPDVFVIAWTGKGPRANVDRAVGDTADLVIGEENVKRPEGLSDEDAIQRYVDFIDTANWLSDGQKEALKSDGVKPDGKYPQLFAKGAIVIVDNKPDIGRILNPGEESPHLAFVNSNEWKEERSLPVGIAYRIAQKLIHRSPTPQ